MTWLRKVPNSFRSNLNFINWINKFHRQRSSTMNGTPEWSARLIATKNVTVYGSHVFATQLMIYLSCSHTRQMSFTRLYFGVQDFVIFYHLFVFHFFFSDKSMCDVWCLIKCSDTCAAIAFLWIQSSIFHSIESWFFLLLFRCPTQFVREKILRFAQEWNVFGNTKYEYFIDFPK